METKKTLKWGLATIAALMIAGGEAQAQLGSGWTQITTTKGLGLDGETSDPSGFSWARYVSNCSPTICADYASTASTQWGSGTETFRILDSRSNRSEVAVHNDHTSGSHQFEGYVTIYSPLEDESLFQIKFSPNSHPTGSTQIMLRGFQANGGEIRKGGSKVLASGVYGVEKRINVIHLEEDVGGKIMTYIGGVLVDSFTDTEIGYESAFKYGVYGTTNGNVPAVAKWRNVRVFRGGTAPGAGPTARPRATSTSRPRATATARPRTTARPTATARPTSGGSTTWAANKYYAVGVTVTYNGASYRCLQAHTSQTGWEPPNVPALWGRI
jgi:hypothetical protein